MAAARTAGREVGRGRSRDGRALSLAPDPAAAPAQGTAPLPTPLLALIAARCNALSEPALLQILDRIRGGEMTVGALVAATGLRQANASKHLRQPHALALAGRRKEGRFVHYSLADDAVFRRCELTYGRVGAESRASSELLAV